MPKVRILTDRVANQIAAGEVIERPAAVVKELVENALDAGATRIEVEFRHGGRALMRIEDNGCGMARDDALLAIERHATSKIEAAADLDRLASFGFRGEALPSIASVSRFTLQTREATAEHGTEILVNGGRLAHVRDCGRPVGTSIEVAQLFNSVPARRKFLKTDQTEAAHIVQAVRLYALAFPEVAFSLIEDGRRVFASPQCTELPDRVGEIFGRQLAAALVPIDVSEAGLRLHGLIGRPGVGRSTRHEMIAFVNRRPVDSRTLNYALIESYHESLPKGRYPPAFVFLEIEPAAVDVNVHPAKREVRFRSEPAVRGFVIRAVLNRLREIGAEAAPGALAQTPASAITAAPEILANPAARQARAADVASVSLDGPKVARPVPPIAPRLGAGWAPPVSSSTPSVVAGDGGTPNSSPVAEMRPVAGPDWRFIGLAHGDYALFETAAGLVLLDRRAAQERIWFERLQAQFRAGPAAAQRLLLPVPVELDPIATALLLDRLEFFRGHGFEVAEFGRNFFRIETVPDWMEPADAEPFLRDLLGALREGQMQARETDVAREQLARLAATRAARREARVTTADMQALVTALFACRSPLTSPGGRPTQIELSHGELARRFQK